MQNNQILPKITPAHRFHAQRVMGDLTPGSLEERAIRKATYIESFPASYPTVMFRWAEEVLLALWDLRPWSEVEALFVKADEAGWLK